MTDREIDRLLSEGLGDVANEAGSVLRPWHMRDIGGGTRTAASLLKTDCVYDGFTMPDLDFERLGEALASAGKVVESDPVKGEHVVVVGSGVGGVNPAVVVVRLMNGDVNMSAYAKEGLLKQNTAGKAINKIKEIIVR